MTIRQVLSAAATIVAVVQTSASADSLPLSGRYVLESTGCVGALNFDQGNEVPRGFEVGSIIEVNASSRALTLVPRGDVALVDAVTYVIGTFDDNEAGPVSDGPVSVTNKYLFRGHRFSHVRNNLKVGDHFGSGIVIQKTGAGLAIDFNDGAATCRLSPYASDLQIADYAEACGEGKDEVERWDVLDRILSAPDYVVGMAAEGGGKFVRVPQPVRLGDWNEFSDLVCVQVYSRVKGE